MLSISNSFLCFLLTLFSITNARAFFHRNSDGTGPRANHTISNEIGFCFNQETHPGIGFPNLANCHSAMGQLVREPGFVLERSFSRNWRLGIEVPKQWLHGDCTVFVSCGNDYDSDSFRYADIAHAAQNVIRSCIEDQPKEPYGGLKTVGRIGSFYVAVGRPKEHPHGDVLIVNGSEVATARAQNTGGSGVALE